MTTLVWKSKAWDQLTRDEMYAIVSSRIEVFVIEQNCPYQDCDDKDQHSHHLWAEDLAGNVCAYLRVVHPGVSYKEISIGRVLTSASHRRTGLGRELMKRGMEMILAGFGQVPVRISAQVYLSDFYSDFGFCIVGEGYLEDNIPHIEMLYTP